MGIFSEQYLKETCNSTFEIITEDYDILLQQDQLFEVMIDKIDRMESAIDDGVENVVTENFIEEIRDDFDNLITWFKHGTAEVHKKNAKAAQEANDYVKEVHETIFKNKVVFRTRDIEMYEVFMIAVPIPGTNITIELQRKPFFSGKVADFQKALASLKSIAGDSNARKDANKLIEKYQKDADAVLLWAPRSQKRMIVTKADNLLKLLTNKLSEHKKASEEYQQSIEGMISAIESGKNMIKDLKDNKDMENFRFIIRYIKKLLSLQKRIYNHDTHLAFAQNRAIIWQSRYARDLIKKYAKKGE